jgi:hypothetical protein
MPHCDEETLNKVPLAGSEQSLRAEKFLLGRLSPHRGKTVNTLISQSVIEHLSRRTFNSCHDICGFLVSLGLEVDDDMKAALPELDHFIQRRHQIVHRADCVGRPAKLAHVDIETVVRFCYSCDYFCTRLSQNVLMKVSPRSAHAWTRILRPSKRLIASRFQRI